MEAESLATHFKAPWTMKECAPAVLVGGSTCGGKMWVSP